MQYLEAVAIIPGDLILDTVYTCIVLGACQSLLVLFDGIDSLPSARGGECNGITAHASEAIDKDRLVYLCGM